MRRLVATVTSESFAVTAERTAKEAEVSVTQSQRTPLDCGCLPLTNHPPRHQSEQFFAAACVALPASSGEREWQ